MSKLFIQLNEGSFLDYFGGNQYITCFRPYVVNNTPAISGLIASGKAKLISKLRDDASDEVYAAAYEKAGKKADVNKVNEAFLKVWDEKGKGFTADNSNSTAGNGNSIAGNGNS